MVIRRFSRRSGRGMGWRRSGWFRRRAPRGPTFWRSRLSWSRGTWRSSSGRRMSLSWRHFRRSGSRSGASLADGAVRLVVLTNPHNPTGVLLGAAEMAEIAGLAESAGALLLVDEVYRDIWFEDAPPSHVHLGPHVLVTNSLTKSHGLSGLRCGWVLCGTRELADRLRRAVDFMEAAGSLPSAGLALAAFRQLDRLAARARSILEPNLFLVRAFLAEHADRLDCVLPERSLMAFPRLRQEEDAQALHDWLRGRETSIVPGRFFDNPGFFRLGFAVRTEDVAAGLGHLAAGLRRPPGD